MHISTIPPMAMATITTRQRRHRRRKTDDKELGMRTTRIGMYPPSITITSKDSNGIAIVVFMPRHHLFSLGGERFSQWWCTPLQWYAFFLASLPLPPHYHLMKCTAMSIDVCAAFMRLLEVGDLSTSAGTQSTMGFVIHCTIYSVVCTHTQ
jgi:hypothetical protein